MRRGDQIAYIPWHAKGDINHPDVQFGFITSVRDIDHVFCRYWNKGEPGSLRTKSCSEMTPIGNLILFDSVDPSLVEKALRTYCPE